VQSVDLVPGGASIPVTMDNRQEYVDAYVKYTMTYAVVKPFEAFESGFMRVCSGHVLVSLWSRLRVGNLTLDFQ